MERAYWGPKSETFEYWSHAACVLPLEDWPAYAFKRRARRAKGKRWHVLEERDKTCNEVLARLRGEGPLTANELGGAKKGGPWWDWSETKIAAEWLLDIGELVCRERRGFAAGLRPGRARHPGRAAGAGAGATRSAPCACVRGGGALAGRGDRGRPGRVPRAAAAAGPPGAGVLRADAGVGGRDGSTAAYADPGALGARWAPGCAGRSVLLSPFDSLIWYRERLERLFGLRHRLEAYTPKEKRTYGYFAMPVLAGTRIVGLVDPGRRGDALVAKQVTLLRPDAARAGGARRWWRRRRGSARPPSSSSRWSRRRPGASSRL